jgi:hypothetical protein
MLASVMVFINQRRGLSTTPLEERMAPMTDDRRDGSFDELAKGLANGSISRGKALRLMGAALAGGALASIPGIASASPRPRPNGKHCKTNSQCASNNCQGGVCQASSGGVCPPFTTNCGGFRQDCVSTTCPSGQFFDSNRTCSCQTKTGVTVRCVYRSTTATPDTVTGTSCYQDSYCPTQEYMDSLCGPNAQYIGDGSYTYESASCSPTDYC